MKISAFKANTPEMGFSIDQCRGVNGLPLAHPTAHNKSNNALLNARKPKCLARPDRHVACSRKSLIAP